MSHSTATTLPEEEDLAVDRQNLSYRTDDGIGHRARIGLIVLATDQTIEHEFRRMLDLPGVALYQSRIWNDPQVTPDTLRAMEGTISEGTRVIVPNVELDVVAYACTSGAATIGEPAVHARIRDVRPGVACTSPMEATVAALAALGARRVAFITPYVDAINRRMRAYLSARGLEVPVMASWNVADDGVVARICRESVSEAVLEFGGHPAVDAAFVSCTSLRVAEDVEALEAALGKPVTSSNHALAWHCLRLAGYDDAVTGFGQLFRTGLDGTVGA